MESILCLHQYFIVDGIKIFIVAYYESNRYIIGIV
jgi:hypothetical protein